MRASVLAVGLAVLAILAALAPPNLAAGQPASSPAPKAPSETPASSPLVFEFFGAKVGMAHTQLINGQTVTTQPKDWPAVLLTPLERPTAGQPVGSFCTGTLVGPAMVLLAAHCLDQRTQALRPAFLKVAGVTVQLTCEVAPAYLTPDPSPSPTPRHSQDFALCYADTQAGLGPVRTMLSETIDTRLVPQGAPVLMMGYGCTDLNQSVQDQLLRLGDAVLSRSAGGVGAEIAYAQILSHGPPEPALCPGDSGGPLITGATQSKHTLSRRVRGVNSSIAEVPQGLLSRVAMLSDPSFAPWAKAFIARFPGAYICGLGFQPQGAKCRP